MIIDVGLDIGNSTTVIYMNKKKEIIFPSLVKNGYDSYTEESKIQFENEDGLYSVGTGMGIINETKYFSKTYKVLLLTALAKVCKNDMLEEFNVGIGLPAESFRDEKLKEKIKTHILSWGSQNIKVDKKKFNIKIDDVEIWTEAGIIMSDMAYYAKKKVIIIDIGGYTRDKMAIENNKRTDYSTEPRGILTLKDEIFKEFKRNNDNVNLKPKSIDEMFNGIVNGTEFIFQGKSLELTAYKRYVQSYCDEIFNDISLSYNSKDYEILFIGGGSLDLETFLEKYKEFYHFEIAKNAISLNAQSYYYYAKLRREKRGKKLNDVKLASN